MVGWNHQPDNLTIAMVIQVDPAPKNWRSMDEAFVHWSSRTRELNNAEHMIKIESQSLVNQIVNGLV